MNDDVADPFLGGDVNAVTRRVWPPPPPFRVGDRVRMTLARRRRKTRLKSYTGTVLKVTWVSHSPGWWVRVRRDGLSPKSDPSEGWSDEWEPDDGVRPFSEAAVALARAVLAGDTSAAWALADEVFEHAKGGAG